MISLLGLQRSFGAAFTTSRIASITRAAPGAIVSFRRIDKGSRTSQKPSSTLQPLARKKQHGRFQRRPTSGPKQTDGLIEMGSAKAQELLSFQYAVESQDAKQLVSMYPSLMREGLLRAQDTIEIIRGLHNAARVNPKIFTDAALLKLVETFVSHYKRGTLPPHPRAGLHVLGFYRDIGDLESAIAFWTWLASQESGNFLNLQTYGVAIEILAAAGQDLAYCEDLYIQALKAFPNAFNEYLLSPGAVLSQPYLPVTTAGTSMVLLQGITFARLINGDWQNAYLALDTALKLHPTLVPPHFMKLFLRFRPIAECFQVFCLICQSGSSVRPADTLQLMNEIAFIPTPGRVTHFGQQAANALLSILRFAIHSRQELNELHLASFLTAALQILPQNDELDPDQKAVRSNLRADLFSSTLAIFKSLNIPAGTRTYAAFVSVAGQLRDESLVNKGIADFFASDLEFNKFTTWVFLNALANIGNIGQVESMANAILDVRRDFIHEFFFWKALATAAVQARDPGIFYRILDNTDLVSKIELTSISKFMVDAMQEDVRRQKNTKGLESNKGDAKDATTFAMGFQRDLRTLELTLSEELSINLKNAPQKEIPGWTHDHVYADKWYDTLYKEINTGSSAATELPSPAYLTKTGFTLQDIRYKNWKGTSDLLLKAKAFETERLADLARSNRPMKGYRPAEKGVKKNKRRARMETEMALYETGIGKQRTEFATEETWKSEMIHVRRIGEYMQ